MKKIYLIIVPFWFALFSYLLLEQLYLALFCFALCMMDVLFFIFKKKKEQEKKEKEAKEKAEKETAAEDKKEA